MTTATIRDGTRGILSLLILYLKDGMRVLIAPKTTLREAAERSPAFWKIAALYAAFFVLVSALTTITSEADLKTRLHYHFPPNLSSLHLSLYLLDQTRSAFVIITPALALRIGVIWLVTLIVGGSRDLRRFFSVFLVFLAVVMLLQIGAECWHHVMQPMVYRVIKALAGAGGAASFAEWSLRDYRSILLTLLAFYFFQMTKAASGLSFLKTACVFIILILLMFAFDVNH